MDNTQEGENDLVKNYTDEILSKGF